MPAGANHFRVQNVAKKFCSWNSGTQHSRLFFPFCVVRPQVQTKKGPVRGKKICTCGCTPATTASTHNRKDRPYHTIYCTVVIFCRSLDMYPCTTMLCILPLYIGMYVRTSYVPKLRTALYLLRLTSGLFVEIEVQKTQKTVAPSFRFHLRDITPAISKWRASSPPSISTQKLPKACLSDEEHAISHFLMPNMLYAACHH